MSLLDFPVPYYTAVVINNCIDDMEEERVEGLKQGLRQVMMNRLKKKNV